MPIPPRLTLHRRTSSVPAAQTPGSSSLLLLATSVVIIAGLYFGRSVLIPVTLAVLLSFLLAPLVELLDRIRIPNFLAALLAVIIALSVVIGVGGLIGTQVADLAGQVPRYATTVEAKISAVQSFASKRFDSVMHSIPNPLHPSPARPKPGTAPAAAPAANNEPKPIPVEVHSPPTPAMEMAQQILSPLIDPLASLAIVFITATFILAQREDLRDRMIRLFGASDLHRTTIAMDDTARRLSRYFLAQFAINVIFGAVIGTALYVIGLPTPLLWGIIAMLLRFLPYIGSPLAAVLPVLLAAATSPGWAEVAETAALFAVLETITGQVVEPVVYGRSTGLSPSAVVIAAIFWTWIWGPIGLILSTPLTLCFMVLGRHVERLEFLDILLGDRPALQPDESFYQRLLAGDPDEAREQAEQYLKKDESLIRYYDEVAIPGLRRAAVDAEAGTLEGPQLERVLESAYELIEELADEAEQASPAATEAWQAHRGTVLCIAGRGPLDETMARMLAQVLGERGVAARVVPHRAVSRSEIAGLQGRNTAMLCLCYLDLSSGVSHIRFLLRRLRRVLPDVPIMVGIWPSDVAAAQDDRMRGAVGADHHMANLPEAVAACLEVSPRRTDLAEPAHAA